jgi:predicted nucleotidyltransferase component of viral defense system
VVLLWLYNRGTEFLLIWIFSVIISSLEDIDVMKLNAIANRGAQKDIYDIYSLRSIPMR